MIWASLIALGSELFTGWREDRKQKREIKAAAAENRARLLREKESHNRSWEMTALEGKDTLLQRFSFGLLSAPFVVAIFDAQAVNEYFVIALAAVPEWYQWAYVAVLGAVWGISEFKQWRG